MKIRNLAFTLAILVAAMAPARAEEKFAVKVFDGATYDADTSQAVAKMGFGETACYRTSATLAQVIDFYKKQPGITVVHTSDKGAMFSKGSTNITLQSPWMDMKTGQRRTDTLISIVKSK